jgi:hypothetical protein
LVIFGGATITKSSTVDLANKRRDGGVFLNIC